MASVFPSGLGQPQSGFHYLICCQERGIFLGLSSEGPIWSRHPSSLAAGAALCLPSLNEAFRMVVSFLLAREPKEFMNIYYQPVSPDTIGRGGQQYASVYACTRAGLQPWLNFQTVDFEICAEVGCSPYLN